MRDTLCFSSGCYWQRRQIDSQQHVAANVIDAESDSTGTIHVSQLIYSTGNDSAPIQLAQCRFPAMAISNAKILIYFLNKIQAYGSNFIKHTWKLPWFENFQNADCSLRKNCLVI